MKRVILLVAALSVALAGCSVSPGDKVDVTMRDFSIDLRPTTVESGRVRFAIDSVGEATHDLKFMLAANVAALPRTPEGKLDLVANRPVDEIETFEPGHYMATSPLLNPGHYVVVCTIHVDQGMVSELTVKPRKKAKG